MTRHMKTGLIPTVLLFIFSSAHPQSSTFNQNSARSNHAKMMAPGFDFRLTPQYGINLNDADDSLFFSGNSTGFKMDAGYSFGNFGIGFSSGFISAPTDKTKINEFLLKIGAPPDQLLISTGHQQNAYLLLGPTASFGEKIRTSLHAKGGLFINNSGYVNSQRKGSVVSLYRNEPASKSVFPGFSAGLNLHYPVSDLISIGFGADYLNTKSEVINYDIRRGNGAVGSEGIKLSQNISSLMFGISFGYTIKSPRDIASGQSTGKQLGKPKYEDIKMNEQVSNNARGPRQTTSLDGTYNSVNNKQSCGPVTRSITHPDGTTEQMTFACPDDAIAYERQTPKRDFGERNFLGNNTGNYKKTFSAPHVFEQKGTISGRVSWTSLNTGIGIVTNKTIRGGSTNLNSQTSSTRTTPSSSFGTMVRLSAREAGSGMATGKRQFEPVFTEGQTEV